MEVVTRTLRWQRALLYAVLAVSVLGFWRATYDVFNTTKATIILVGAVAILGVGTYRAARTRRVSLPRTPVAVAAAVLAVALIAATLTSTSPMASLVGRPGRHTGLAAYLTYLALFVVAVKLYRDHAPTALVKTLLAVAVPVTAYGLLQAGGIEPLGWQAVEGGPQVFSTFGNANFFAAFLGMVVPLAVWGALAKSWALPWRLGSAMLAMAAFAATVASHSQQGPAIAVVGSALVAGVAIASEPAVGRTAKAALLGGGALLAALLAVGVAAGVGPLETIRSGLAASLGTRTPKWETALAIFRDHPLTGVGLERFADYFHEYRPASLAAETGLRRTTDTPHNIPLDMLANGGAPLALAYVAFVGLTGWALVVGLRRNRGEDRLLLAGIGGAWLAYQLQSLVSIDVPPIAVLHYVLAGALVALATRPALQTLRLPGAAPEGKRGRVRMARPNPLVTAVIAAVGLTALVVVTAPLRADLAAGLAFRLGTAQPDAAAASYQRAADIAFWEARYPALEGALLSSPEVDRPSDALAAHQRAARREPRGLAHALNVARLQASLGQLEQADRAWEQVLQIDPKTPEVLAEAGRYWLARGEVDRAGDLVEQAVATREDDAYLWVSLGEVRAAAQDTAAARAAFQRALEIDPLVEGGAEGLARVNGLA